MATAGEHVLRFVENLTIPYVVTLHTVLPRYDDDQLRVIRQLCRNAATVVVFTSSARRLMLDQGIVPARFLQVVAHGAPSELYKDVDTKAARERLGLPASAPVMSTFGLLSQGKGIELAIQAMALLNTEHPGSAVRHRRHDAPRGRAPGRRALPDVPEGTGRRSRRRRPRHLPRPLPRPARAG